MTCSEITDIYLKSLRSDISPEESALLNEHINSCTECRQAFAWDSVIAGAVRKDLETVPDEAFVSKICREIVYTRQSAKERFYDLVSSSIGVVMPVFVFGALLLIFRTEIQNNILPGIYYYYNLFVDSINEWVHAVPELRIPDKFYIFDYSRKFLLVWMGMSGIASVIALLTARIYSFRRW